jgi:hypothetical protein
MAPYDEQELTDRAVRAYATRARREGLTYHQPSNVSGVCEYDGQDFVLLENISGPIAVYRVKGDGHLEFVREEHWPAELYLAGQDIDYDRLHRAMDFVVTGPAGLSAETKRWVMGTPCPVPGKGLVPVGQMTVDDHKAASRYLRSHKGLYPGERPAATV